MFFPPLNQFIDAPGFAGGILRFYQSFKVMLDLFIELTDQLFWEGYARALAEENPALFQFEFNEFLNNYCDER